MKELTEKAEQSETKKAPKETASKRGRKPSGTKGSKAPKGRGGARLRESVNDMVDKQAKDIAQALVNKSVAGNMAGTRLVVGMTGADKAPPEAKKRKKKTKTSLYVKQLCSEPEWEGPWEDEDGHRDASRLPLSDYDLPADLK